MGFAKPEIQILSMNDRGRCFTWLQGNIIPAYISNQGIFICFYVQTGRFRGCKSHCVHHREDFWYRARIRTAAP